MLRILGWMIKTTVFTVFILIAGHWIRWHGVTLSDHIKTGMSQVERTASRLQLTPGINAIGLKPTSARKKHAGDPADQITSKDQQELKNLLESN